MSAEQLETTECFACHGIMRKATKLERVQYENLVSDAFEAPFFRCERCGMEMEIGRDMRVTEQQMSILMARFHDALLVSAS